MTKSACCRVPMITIAGSRTSGFGQKYSPAATARTITATSAAIAAVARHGERRVKRCSSSFGSALRKSSLNSSPLRCASLVEAAQQDVLHLEILLEAVLGALAAQARLLDPAERRHLGRDD